MPRHLRGPALDHCPQCDTEYGSVSQHWAMSADCTYPPIPDRTHELLAGLLLGDANLDDPNERPALRIGTAKRAFAEWLYDELDWLPTSLRVETFDDPTKQPRYLVRTIAHPDFDRYRDWYVDGSVVPPTDLKPTPPLVRAYHACDGCLDFGPVSRPRITYSAVDDARRERIAKLLGEIDVEVRAQAERVAVVSGDVDAYLEWLGEPVPGVEYKWATDRETYEARRLG